jgi:hypothetical protein
LVYFVKYIKQWVRCVQLKCGAVRYSDAAAGCCSTGLCLWFINGHLTNWVWKSFADKAKVNKLLHCTSR